jgi:hypothetical protein
MLTNSLMPFGRSGELAGAAAAVGLRIALLGSG